MNHILIIGATSGIAEQTARCFAGQGAQLSLVARNQEKLETVAADLKTRGAASVHTYLQDGSDHAAIPGISAKIKENGALNGCLIAHGSLGDQEICENDLDAALKELDINFMSACAWSTEVAKLLAEQKSGTLAVISSVAGLRGRQSNYVYGAGKGGLNVFLQGLRNRMSKLGVNVITILPGFVDTPMTAHLPKGKLFASAESVGARIHRAMREGGPDVLYTPWIWRWIMLIIRMIPEPIFKKLSL